MASAPIKRLDELPPRESATPAHLIDLSDYYTHSFGLEGLLEEYQAAWCGPVKLEVLGGARAEDRTRLEEWFACIPYRVMTESDWDQAKARYWTLRDQGQTLPWSDMLIGSLALSWDCRVYAMDRHFEVMRELLGLRLYQPGYGGKYAPEPGGT